MGFTCGETRGRRRSPCEQHVYHVQSMCSVAMHIALRHGSSKIKNKFGLDSAAVVWNSVILL